jgi:hypothetical protein
MLRSIDITTTITVGILLVAIAIADTMTKDMLTDLPVEHPIVIGHRGENALAVLNPDGSIIEATTDVADRPEFAGRKTTKSIDGVAIM